MSIGEQFPDYQDNIVIGNLKICCRSELNGQNPFLLSRGNNIV